MSPKDTLEQRIARIAALADGPIDAGALSRLRSALRGRDNHLAAAAAKITGRLKLTDLTDDLAEAFDRFMVNPASTDKGCAAKVAIVEALSAMESDRTEIYRAGVRHVQMEPVWGTYEDTADKLRGLCGLGLTQCGDPEAPFELVRLLNDPAPYPRKAAVAALDQIGDRASELLLRQKALQGDSDTAVVGECFSALMRLDAGHSMGFVAGFLENKNPQVAEEAALALGESHRPDCLEILLEARASRADEDWRGMMLLPIALTRLEAAFEELRRVIGEEHERMAIAAIEAAGLFRADPDRVDALRDAVGERKSRLLSETFRKVFCNL